jgi:hypothetical protein
MTVNELVGRIYERIVELGKLKMPVLRREHPDAADEEIPTKWAGPKRATAGMSREQIIADIILEEFSDAEIDE